MPYVSQKQRAFFNANKDELEKKGVDVDEWNQASKGEKLPEQAPVQPKSKKIKPNRPDKPKSLGAVTHTSITKM
jgi:hypothetical protein